MAPRHVVTLLRNVVIAAALVYGIGWRIADGGPLAAVIAAIALCAVLAWHARMVWWLESELWSSHLLDLPRRRRAIAGPGPGTWATDVVPADGRYAALLLHFGERGAPAPPPADDVPDEPWGDHARIGSRTKRTIVALEWADDARTAQAAAARMRPPPGPLG
ncbi:MAG TPA: hypothetical protein VGV67_01165 [Solirubrobacteraceae bacterium]|nr:hypothetical protein [Solirubrobacteraceae bacterium]